MLAAGGGLLVRFTEDDLDRLVLGFGDEERSDGSDTGVVLRGLIVLVAPNIEGVVDATVAKGDVFEMNALNPDFAKDGWG